MKDYPRKTEAYLTSDGKTFTDYIEAKNHQKKTTLTIEVNNLLARDGFSPSCENARIVVQFVNNNAEALYRILKDLMKA